jgi:DNA-binding response OmpR family regulator
MRDAKPHLARSQKRILLVEDNPNDRDILLTALTHEGYDVIEAEDGPTAVIQAMELVPDLVILDLGLPGMSGWDVATVLTGLKKTARTKVLVVTAHMERRQDKERSLIEQVHGYLLKPVEPRVVIAEIEKLIGRPRGEAGGEGLVV